MLKGAPETSVSYLSNTNTGSGPGPHLTAMMVWVLRDYPLTPTFEGGSIKRELPKLKLIEGLNQKGLFTYGGRRVSV